MWRLMAAPVMLALLLSACASAPTDRAFDPAVGNSLLVVAVDRRPSNSLQVFRRIDSQTRQFVGAPVIVQVDTSGGLSVMAPQTLINANSSNRPVSLAIMEVPPGEYAHVEMTRAVSVNQYSYTLQVACLNAASPVFSIAPGAITLIRTDNIGLGPVPENGVVLAEFERARARYPGIVGQVSTAEPVAWLTWPDTRAGIWETRNRNCAEPDGFEVRAAP